MPDLAALDGVSLDAILITHAHADHIGALPLVHAQHPATPIYASPATCCLIEVMLGDAVRVMSRRAAEELDLPLYDDTLVASTLQMLRPLHLGAQRLPGREDLVVHAQRSGHIADTVSLGLDAPDGRLVISGDVSVTPQRTVLGAQTPDPRHPDLLILESTYGARLHPYREVEERRLGEAVATVVERGAGIACFRLSRSDEYRRSSPFCAPLNALPFSCRKRAPEEGSKKARISTRSRQLQRLVGPRCIAATVQRHLSRLRFMGGVRSPMDTTPLRQKASTSRPARC